MDPYREEMKQSLGEIIASLDALDPLQRDFLTRRWLDQLLWMEGAAQKAQRRYFRLRLVTVVGAVVVPALVGLKQRGMAAAELVCDECGAVSKDAAGWKAALADAPLEDGPIGVAIYCPACWAREFDEDEP